jgi:hypothetical protein
MVVCCKQKPEPDTGEQIMADYDAVMGAEEPESEEQYYESLQQLINSGQALRLQGSIGRAAMAAIEAGHCVLGEVGHTDYYGNYVPSRFEVKPGTKGSLGYQQAKMEE